MAFSGRTATRNFKQNRCQLIKIVYFQVDGQACESKAERGVKNSDTPGAGHLADGNRPEALIAARTDPPCFRARGCLPGGPALVGLALKVAVNPVVSDAERTVVGEELNVAADRDRVQPDRPAPFELDVVTHARAGDHRDLTGVLGLKLAFDPDAASAQGGRAAHHDVAFDARTVECAGLAGGHAQVAVDRHMAHATAAVNRVGVRGRGEEGGAQQEAGDMQGGGHVWILSREEGRIAAPTCRIGCRF